MKKLTLPGLIDPHVHLRDPGAVHKEDFDTGTRAAVAGGFSIVLDMPNNPIPTISPQAVYEKQRLIQEKAHCGVGVIYGTNGNNTETFSEVANTVYALKIYMDNTTGNLLVEDDQLLDIIFSSWQCNKPIITHSEGRTMERAIQLAKKYNRHLHIAHVSQQSELSRIIEEKEKGMDITCEVTPHHLFLTEKDAVALGAFGQMKPPLKKQSDVDFLWKHINAIDCIATDHAPHTREEKESGKTYYGVSGLETSLPLMLNAVNESRMSLDDIVALMHDNPKRIFNIVAPVINQRSIEIDMDASYCIDSKTFQSKSKWSPFDGMRVKGRVLEE